MPHPRIIKAIIIFSTLFPVIKVRAVDLHVNNLVHVDRFFLALPSSENRQFTVMCLLNKARRSPAKYYVMIIHPSSEQCHKSKAFSAGRKQVQN